MESLRKGLARFLLIVIPVNINVEIISIFWSRTNKLDQNSCWNWLGAKTDKGYGMLFSKAELNKQYLYAHRVSYLIHNTILTDSLFVCHKCNNPSCVNPNHLYLATSAENTRDAALDNLMPKDEKHWAFKSDVSFIEKVNLLYKEGKTQKEIASIMEVNQSHISRVLNKKLGHSRKRFFV